MTQKIRISRTDQKTLMSAAEVEQPDGYRRDAFALGVYEGDTLVLIMVLDNIGALGPDLHWVPMSPRWASRRLLEAVCRVLFQPAPHGFGFKFLRAITAADNPMIQIMALKTGFEFIARIPAGADRGYDVILMGLDALNCRWLPPVALREIRARRAAKVIMDEVKEAEEA